MTQRSVELPFDTDVISSDNNRDDGNFASGRSFPAELIPNEIQSEDITFAIGNMAYGEKNAVTCLNQSINLSVRNYTKLYLLVASSGDTDADFTIDGNATRLRIQDWTNYVGQFYNQF